MDDDVDAQSDVRPEDERSGDADEFRQGDDLLVDVDVDDAIATMQGDELLEDMQGCGIARGELIWGLCISWDP